MKLAKGLIILSLAMLAISACHPQAGAQANNRYNPKAAKINSQLAVNYLKNNNIDSAKQKINLAVQQNPRSPLIMDTAAFIYSQLGDNTQASNYFEKAIDLAPTAGRFHNNYGVFLCKTGQVRYGIDQLLMAAIDQNYPKRDAAYENAGLCAQKAHKRALAADYYLQALKINPKRPNSLLEMGQISYDMQLYDQAQGYVARYNKVAPANAESLRLSIRVAQKRGDKQAVAKNMALLRQQYPHAKQSKLVASSKVAT